MRRGLSGTVGNGREYKGMTGVPLKDSMRNSCLYYSLNSLRGAI